MLLWENVVSAHGKYTAENRESLGNCFSFSLFLLILCLPNISKKYYHVTGSDQFYVQHKGVLVSVAWGHIVSVHGDATSKNRKTLAIVFGLPLFLLIFVFLFIKKSTSSGL